MRFLSFCTAHDNYVPVHVNLDSDNLYTIWARNDTAPTRGGVSISYNRAYVLYMQGRLQPLQAQNTQRMV